jgi:outer membrane receptor protein involved in Fe transport
MQFKSGALLASAGAYYLDGTDLELFAFYFAPPVTSGPITSIGDPINQPGALLLTNALTQTRNNSYFAEIQYGFLDNRMRLGAEARYTQETKTVTNRSNGQRLSSDFNFFTPRVTLDYDLAPGKLLYASAAKGVKAGGFNPTAFLVENRTYDPDKNWTYEIGSKNVMFDRRLQLNVSAFYTKWSNLQVNSPNIGSPTAATAAQIVLNFGNATTYGLEIEAAAQLTEHLQLNTAISKHKSTFDAGTVDGVAIRQPTPCDNVVCRADGIVGGNDLPRQSNDQFALGFQWEHGLGAWDAEYYVRADAAYQSKQYLEHRVDPGADHRERDDRHHARQVRSAALGPQPVRPGVRLVVVRDRHADRVRVQRDARRTADLRAAAPREVLGRRRQEILRDQRRPTYGVADGRRARARRIARARIARAPRGRRERTRQRACQRGRKRARQRDRKRSRQCARRAHARGAARLVRPPARQHRR